jgi:DNA-binding PadR family transcriptional regulator
MTSAVGWVVLGLVLERPGYGMELYHRYEECYADALPIASHTNIYSALRELERRGYVRKGSVLRVGRQIRPCYEITDEGTAAFVDWFVEQVDYERRRQGLLARQILALADHPEIAVRVLRRYQESYLALASSIETSGLPADVAGASREDFVEALVAMHRRILGGGALGWLRSAVSALAARAPGGGVGAA